MANQIVIKKGLKIGQLDAEADKDLLDVCFVDNGQLDELVDVSQPMRRRTFCGKCYFVFITLVLLVQR
jgi:hypothetical protein